MTPRDTAMTGPLVIFDCDGVLVDSEPISIAVLREVIAGAGHDIDEETAYRLFLGRSMTSISETLADSFGLAFTAEHLARIRSRLFTRFHAELTPIPGIRDVLGTMPQRRCVASSSKPERIRLSLGITGLLDLLEPNIYSATMVRRGKPAPDLFLHAADAMGTSPADCIVVEDSPAGIEAARAAGMRVLAFAGGTHARPGGLHRAFARLSPDAVFDAMSDLPALLDEAVSR